VVAWGVGGLGAAFSAVALAQSNDGELGPGLIGPGVQYANAIEAAAAQANDIIFRTLDPDCNPSGALDQIPAPQFSGIASRVGPLCNEDTFFVYRNARELFHSANEIQGQGPTIASLGVDQEGLGLALRWTAAEELAAQGSMATEFANGQLSTLAARLNALRFGATGFRTVGLHEWLRRSSPVLAQAGEGGSAAEDEVREEFTPWGGFLNYGFGYGSKDPTSLEDAFDFDGSEVTLGFDYRFPRNVVVGAMFGLTDQDIDFDEAASAISVVEGDIASDGHSVILFALSQTERLTLSGSIGTQSLDYDIERNIIYPSFNQDLESIYQRARSRPQADATTATFGFGYAFTWTKFTLEPFVNVEYLDVTIDPFAESRSINILSNSEESRRFDLVVSEQQIESLRASAGLRFQFVTTPRFGTVIPHWSIAWHNETKDDARTITAGYAALADVLGSTTFALPTDAPDESYVTASVGVSMILRGGRQRELDGPIVGGITGFFQYATVENRDFYEDQVMTAGFRYEF
jgi:uncharacterized protein YhjY with autotransporter beta-barrel domain